MLENLNFSFKEFRYWERERKRERDRGRERVDFLMDLNFILLIGIFKKYLFLYMYIIILYYVIII